MNTSPGRTVRRLHRNGRSTTGAPARARITGIGLIEILITVLVLSVGFLAVATMQVQGMRSSQSAYHRSQAYFLVTAMADRMRANVRGVQLGAYDGLATSDEAIDPDCATTPCDAEGTAEQDLFDWSAHLHPLGGATNFVPTLPGSTGSPPLGTITRLSAGLYRIRVTWDEIVDGDEERQTLEMHLATETL